ncbi:MAG: hypothetical protein CSB46_00285 [Micrococcales bacterium]|nr:MAG: hypothetical protein CSB46_00285 [Micrococcales bacterium]
MSGNSSTYVTGGGNNFGDYSNPEVDAKTAELNKAVEESEQDRLITDIEKLLWSDLATIPLFAHPGVNAQAANLEGVVFQPSQSEVTWNMDQWTMAAE